VKVINPRTGEAEYAIAPLDAAAVQTEAARLRAAQPAWAALEPEARSAILHRWADAVVAQREPLLDALTRDTGRRRISEIEVDGLPMTIRRWADLAPKLIAEHTRDNQPSAHPMVRNSTRPALAAGCAALVKPSEITPRFIAPLRETIAQVPELAAVLSFIEGDAATGQALVEAVDYVCFTGSVATGRKVAEAAARAFVPANLELGGKDPMIVLASADPVAAAQLALRASIVATGQACQSIERLYVARAIYQPFLDALVAAAGQVRLNYPDISAGEIGPFIFGPQAAKVQAQIDEAVAMGARVLTGGTVETLGGGQYLKPTVIANATADMAVVRDETFGPVLPVIAFDDVEDAIQQANDSIYGLSAAVVAETAEEAEAVAVRLEAGAVSINDGSLTSMVWDAENSSFKLSGMGPSRMGESGLLRYFRKQALIRQTAAPLPLAAYAEDAPR
jgi:acyl-CoA reductase-like NAD-dependent aldehyde dehydrogenase